jgi:hypothetical protein
MPLLQNSASVTRAAFTVNAGALQRCGCLLLAAADVAEGAELAAGAIGTAMEREDG